MADGAEGAEDEQPQHFERIGLRQRQRHQHGEDHQHDDQSGEGELGEAGKDGAGHAAVSRPSM